MGEPGLDLMADDLLAWYDHARRDLPWRAGPGARVDPYHVWISEIMLQQTVARVVVPYFTSFVTRWPEISDLARAPLDDVLKVWAGLGYYARARNMHDCARIIQQRFSGRFPDDPDDLLSLPGVGSYTMAAISAIAYGRQIVPVDGNVKRVMARYHAIETPLPAACAEIQKRAQELLPCSRTGDLAQALMDLGAMVCVPRNPVCQLCPLNAGCVGHSQGLAADLPRRMPKKKRPVRRANVFWLEREDGYILVRTRPPDGLLGAMTEIPSGPWVDEQLFRSEDGDAPARVEWRRVPGHVRHIFTHFELIADIWRADVPVSARCDLLEPSGCRFVHRMELAREALPSVMRKIANHVSSVLMEE